MNRKNQVLSWVLFSLAVFPVKRIIAESQHPEGGRLPGASRTKNFFTPGSPVPSSNVNPFTGTSLEVSTTLPADVASSNSEKLLEIESAMNAQIVRAKGNEEKIKLIEHVAGIERALLDAGDTSKTEEERHTARVKQLEWVVGQMRELPYCVLSEFSKDIERLSKYKNADALNNKALDLLAVIENPKKQEMKKTLKFPNSTRTDVTRLSTVEDFSVANLKAIERNLAELNKLKTARDVCSANHNKITEWSWFLEAEIHRQNIAAAKKTVTLEDDMRMVGTKLINTELKLFHKKSGEEDSFIAGSKSALDVFESVFGEGNGNNVASFFVHNNERLEKVTELVVPNATGTDTLKIKNFAALGEKQDLYSESLEDNAKKDNFMYTLTPKGEKWFKAIFPHVKEFKKVSANELKLIDKIWAKTVKLSEDVRKDPEYLELLERRNELSKSIDELSKSHDKEIAELKALKDKLLACQSTRIDNEQELKKHLQASPETYDSAGFHNGVKSVREKHEELEKAQKAAKEEFDKSKHGSKR